MRNVLTLVIFVLTLVILFLPSRRARSCPLKFDRSVLFYGASEQ